MREHELAVMAHLLRRAGFGATRDELESYASKDYEGVVEDLLHPERFPEVEEDVLHRYRVGALRPAPYIGRWIYRMVNTQRPLEEKVALFWHHVFATAVSKTEHPPSNIRQIETFRLNGMSDLRSILCDLSRDAAMIYWLDNCENHKDEPNENYGRELLELFSMGVGNYTEHDIKAASRAFTGWTFRQPIPYFPHGWTPAHFEYRQDDHDGSVKTFLGETGRFNGEDIIDIIVKQRATSRFISRHLYNFFVADEPPVSALNEVPPQDEEAIDTLSKAYFDSEGKIRAMLRVLFNSDFFKAARFKKVKSPAELVAGTIKLVGTHRFPDQSIVGLGAAAASMGQNLLNPPTVEGWHTGNEWIDGGALNERVNFAVDELANVDKPGIQDIVARLSAEGSTPGGLQPKEFVARCLDLVGPMEVGSDARDTLLRHAEPDGPLRFDTEPERAKSSVRVGRMLQLIVASREYQLA